MELAAICLLVILGVSAIFYAGMRQQKRGKGDSAAAGDPGAPVPASRGRSDDMTADGGGE